MRPRIPAVLVSGLMLAACTSSTVDPSRSAPGPSSSGPKSRLSDSFATGQTHSPPPGSAPVKHHAVGPAQRIFDAMSESQRVGQLLMVDCSTTGVSSATSTAITKYRVGSVILDGTSQAGLSATRGVTAQLRSLAPHGIGLFISTDQEGGLVQRLQGPGFSSIPSGLAQGGTSPSALRNDAQVWGAQLRQAGVNVNLAPVLDTVPADFGPNPPIGDLDREYGHTPAAVTSHGVAVVNGMTAAGIDVTVKHFPGLGRVTGNTDTTAGVRDTVTTRHDAYLAPFKAAIAAHVPFVMMSTAIYSRIDANNPAAFSKTIVTGMLRGDLGFHGLIISDDLGGAAQVSYLSPAQRAVAFVAAGGDVVLTVNATQAAAMTAALLAKTKKSAAFKKLVDTAALLVLKYKQARGLL